MLKEIALLASIFAVSGLTALLTILVAPLVGILASGVLGYILYRALS